MSRLRYLTAGESHGPGLTAVLDGCPAGLTVDPGTIDAELRRRQSGYGRGERQSIEQDTVRILVSHVSPGKEAFISLIGACIGAPVGCVLVSPTHVYPGPVGVDIKCSMSFLQLDLPADQVADKTVRRALI